MAGEQTNGLVCADLSGWRTAQNERQKKIIRHPEAGISRPCPLRSICCEVTLKSPPFLLRSDLVFHLPQRAEGNVRLTRAIFANFMVDKIASLYCIFSFNCQSEFIDEAPVLTDRA